MGESFLWLTLKHSQEVIALKGYENKIRAIIGHDS